VNDPRSRIRRVVVEDDGAAGPLDAIALAAGEPAFYWRSDERDIEIAALGAVAVVETSGPARFDDASAKLRTLAASIDDAGAGLPLAVGGFAFDDRAPSSPWEGFPSLRFFVPRVVWIRQGGRRRMVIAYPPGRMQTPAELLNAAVTPVPPCGSVDDSTSWRRRVEAAVEAIRSGRLRKIVLARRRSVPASSAPSMTALLGSLAESRPSCFTFALRWNGRLFVGSSPERLLRLDGTSVEADALAGTAPRGLSKAHDESLARELAASPKEAREHRIVADAIQQALAPLALEVVAPDKPALVSLPEAHHLHTPVHARLAPAAGRNIFDIAARLHPTPAVCGEPREEASRQLAGEEADRGWYGGGVGWVTAGGDGELAVALRAALLGDSQAHVWAGAGIVEGSSPEHEYDETERKMQSILPYFERGDDECAA
jgi:isochorismate synthase